jgi:tRNA threonylcarbamoyladenosine biosynthesis protein TsaE
MFEVGYDEYVSGDGVCLIEWADMIEDILPETYYRVFIEKDMNEGPDYRKIVTQKIG